MSTGGRFVVLTILSYNIARGGRGREEALVAVIREARPDLVVFQEARDPEVIAHVARATEMTQWGAQPGQSLGFMAREPVAHVAWHRPRVSRHAFIEILPAGSSWRLFGVHLSAVHAAWTERRRVFELRALLSAVARREHGPHALIGDFNTVAPGEVLDLGKLPSRLRALVWLSGGRIRWRTIQTVLDAGYVDTFRARHPDLVGSTFPTWDPHIRLDYLFTPQIWTDRVVDCRVVHSVTARAASDHLPLLATLSEPVRR